MKMLAGFRSRWMTPMAWHATRQSSSRAFPRVADRLAFEQLHDEERRFVLGAIVVEHGDTGGVTDLVGDVALAKETLADGLVAGKVEVEDLQRGPLAVAMRGRIHGGHATDAQEGFDGPLPLDERTYALLGAVIGFVRIGQCRIVVFGRLLHSR
jgi:hypothetical protein